MTIISASQLENRLLDIWEKYRDAIPDLSEEIKSFGYTSDQGNVWTKVQINDTQFFFIFVEKDKNIIESYAEIYKDVVIISRVTIDEFEDYIYNLPDFNIYNYTMQQFKNKIQLIGNYEYLKYMYIMTILYILLLCGVIFRTIPS